MIMKDFVTAKERLTFKYNRWFKFGVRKWR